MAEHEQFSGDVLVGRDAVAWFRDRRKFGPQLLDLGLTALADSFEQSRRLGAYVPSLGPPGLRRDFFLAVDGDIGSDHDWGQLIDAYLRLDERSSDVRESPRFRRERSAFNLVLWRDPPESVAWTELQEQWFRAG